MIGLLAVCAAGFAVAAGPATSGTAAARCAKPVTPGAEWTKGKPEDHGFDPAALAKVSDYIRANENG